MIVNLIRPLSDSVPGGGGVAMGGKGGVFSGGKGGGDGSGMF